MFPGSYFPASYFAGSYFAGALVGAITYPLEWPEAIIPARIRWSPFTVVGVAQSPFSLVRQAQRHPGQRWEGMVEVPIAERGQWAEFEAFRLSLNGQEGTFLLSDPLHAAPRGTALGTPVASGSNLARSQLLRTAGWTPSQPLVLRAMDFIQLGTGSAARLHAVLRDAAADSAGEAVLTIWPRLRGDVAAGTVIVTDNPAGRFALAGNVGSWDEEPGGLFTIAPVEIVEVI